MCASCGLIFLAMFTIGLWTLAGLVPPTAPSMDAGQVAQAGFDGFKKNQAIVIPGLKNRLTAFMTRLAPRFAVRKLVKRLQVPGQA